MGNRKPLASRSGSGEGRRTDDARRVVAAKPRLVEWARSLRDEEPQLLLESPSVSPEQQTVEYPSRTPTTLAEKLRELAELREAELITEVEFEAKKKDLLDRM
jgi:hypothetical protein